MATTAQFVSAPIIDITQIGPTAFAGRTGGGTIGNEVILVCSGPTFIAGPGVGKRITRGIIQGVSGNSAGVIKFFISPDGGTTRRLYLEKPVTSTSATPTSSSYRTEIPELIGFVFPGISGTSNVQLYAATHAGDTYNIVIESGTL